jgi:cation transport protein ChaC
MSRSASKKGESRIELPPGQDFWVFGYGSLMWNPGFPHLEVQVGLLRGYHRSFCIFSHVYRGTPDRPGLVLGLDRGGSCRGLAYRVPAAEGELVLDYLYKREMVTLVYKARWLKVELPTGPVRACGFVVDPKHEQYAGRLSQEEMIELIIQGEGATGPCRNYLANTVRHLEALGIGADPLIRLLRMVEARCGGTRGSAAAP